MKTQATRFLARLAARCAMGIWLLLPILPLLGILGTRLLGVR